MTVNYNAGVRTSLHYIKEALNNEVIDNEELTEFINIFHEFVSNSMFDYFYIGGKTNFLESLGYNLLMEDGDIHLNYLSKGSIKKEELSVGEYR
jgi:hypothetical protein